MFAVVHFPDFVLQAGLRGAPELWELPVALVDPGLTPLRVCAVTKGARSCGVSEGATPTQALARCQDIRIRHRSLAAEAAATEATLQCAYGFSPSLELTSLGMVTLDLRGLAALADNDPAALERWAQRLRAALAALDLRAQVGVGPTPNLARHAARWTDTLQIVIAPREFIAGLPVAALEPSTHVAEILAQWGIRSVGELLALGQAEVADRLGLEALALFAAASPTASRPLRCVRPSERFEEVFDFEEPVETLEPLLFLLRRFVDQLCLRLEPAGLVAQQLTLRLQLESGGPALEQILRVPEPTRASEILFRMLHTHLESVRTEAAITGVGLIVHPSSPTQRQFGLFETVLRDPHQLQETLDRLSALLGAERVGSPVRQPGHQRDAFKLVPPDFENAPAQQWVQPELLQPVPWRRLRPSPAAQVETQEGRPVSVRCAVANGKLKITVGPWRASGNWWEPSAWAREDWAVETDQGSVCRLSRESEGWRATDVLD
ncbi:MAG TPA: hypothetical protein PLX89_22065 [Verrucomicrobiota bacterium]|nr:hypothetical protein [Verrucomicrobiales bacterium]HRI15692.1 hypothetical protein [Verrucomicrobiota bacterium]